MKKKTRDYLDGRQNQTMSWGQRLLSILYKTATLEHSADLRDDDNGIQLLFSQEGKEDG